MISWRTAGVGLLAAAVTAAGCGGGDGDEESQAPPPVPHAQNFPSPAGKTAVQLFNSLPPSGLHVVPSGADFEPGRQRIGFALFEEADRRQVADAEAVVYAQRVGGGKLAGPFPARYESLAVEPEFQSAGVEADPHAAKTVYVADVEFPRPGRYQLLGVVRRDKRVQSAGGLPVKVAADSAVPEVGEPAPRTSTPTLNDVGDVEEIDTRMPPSTMHDEDLADVLGKKPAVLLFATPALCQSRVCGPVVDIAEQVKARREGDDLAWIHMEIFNDNTVEKGYRPQLREWRLPSEPWLFTIDRRGRVAARIEGAFSASELDRAVDAALR